MSTWLPFWFRQTRSKGYKALGPQLRALVKLQSGKENFFIIWNLSWSVTASRKCHTLGVFFILFLLYTIMGRCIIVTNSSSLNAFADTYEQFLIGVIKTELHACEVLNSFTFVLATQRAFVLTWVWINSVFVFASNAVENRSVLLPYFLKCIGRTFWYTSSPYTRL